MLSSSLFLSCLLAPLGAVSAASPSSEHKVLAPLRLEEQGSVLEENTIESRPRVAFVIVGPTRALASASFATRMKSFIETLAPSSNVDSDVFLYLQLRDALGNKNPVGHVEGPPTEAMRILKPVAIGTHDQLLLADGNERNHSSPICSSPYTKDKVSTFQLCPTGWHDPLPGTSGELFYMQWTKVEKAWNLVTAYEKAHQVTYDWVVRLRTDAVLDPVPASLPSMLAQHPTPETPARIPFYMGPADFNRKKLNKDTWPYADGRVAMSEFVGRLTGAVAAGQGVSPELEAAARATQPFLPGGPRSLSKDTFSQSSRQDLGGEPTTYDGIAFLPRALAPDYFSAVHQLDTCPDLSKLYYPHCASNYVGNDWIGNMSAAILSSTDRQAPLDAEGVRSLVGTGVPGVSFLDPGFWEECLLTNWVKQVKQTPLMPLEQLEMADVVYYKVDGSKRNSGQPTVF